MPNLQKLIQQSNDNYKFNKQRIQHHKRAFNSARMEWAAVELKENSIVFEDLLFEDLISISFDSLYNYLSEFEEVPENMLFNKYVAYLYQEHKAILGDWGLYAWMLPYLDTQFNNYWHNLTKDSICFESLIKTVAAHQPKESNLPTPKEC